MSFRLFVWALCGATVLGGCARELHGDDHASLLDEAGMDGGSADGGSSPFGNPDAASGGGPSDAALAADAFFINDPQPPVCGPDGMPHAGADPGGTASCPDDKNREGCPCPERGMTAACWPGKRINRSHGICKDGVTTCSATDEFGLRWGPCEGYVLPAEGAIAGPEACRCFSDGIWNIENISPCISGDGTFLYASQPTAEDPDGCNLPPTPPTPAAGIWSKSTLKADCSGQFRLCYTIKAGSVSAQRPDDCVAMQTCIDVWYPDEGVEQALPDLPTWISTDAACVAKFVDADADRKAHVKGYGQMTVIGHSSECDAVDDGMGKPFVFYNTDYCEPRDPNEPQSGCQTGGSGMF